MKQAKEREIIVSDKVWAVKQGHEPGVYFSWKECMKQIQNYPTPEFKECESEDKAWDWLNSDGDEISEVSDNEGISEINDSEELSEIDDSEELSAAEVQSRELCDSVVVYVGSDCEASKLGSYGLVFTRRDELLFNVGSTYAPHPSDITGVYGVELYGITEAVRLSILNGFSEVQVVCPSLDNLKVTENWVARNQAEQFYVSYMMQAFNKIKITFLVTENYAHTGWLDLAYKVAKNSSNLRNQGM